MVLIGGVLVLAQLRRLKRGATRGCPGGGGGVADPGGVGGTFRCCAEGRGLMGAVGDGCVVGLGDPGGLFQPWGLIL